MKLLVVIVFVLMAASVGWAQSAAPAPWLNETERAKFEQLRVAGARADVHTAAAVAATATAAAAGSGPGSAGAGVTARTGRR